MSLTDDDIAQILKLIDGTPFDEIDIEWKGVRIHLRRGNDPHASARTLRGDAPKVSAPSSVAASPAPAASTRKTAAPSPPAPPGVDEVRAPTMGTFYRRPEPGAPPFVEQGAAVAVGDTLCLIEVMKVFSAVTAERAGTIEAICVEDGSLVEFEQTIFHLRPHDA